MEVSYCRIINRCFTDANFLGRQFYVLSKGNNSSFLLFIHSLLFTLDVNKIKIIIKNQINEKITNNKIAHYFTQKLNNTNSLPPFCSCKPYVI